MEYEVKKFKTHLGEHLRIERDGGVLEEIAHGNGVASRIYGVGKDEQGNPLVEGIIRVPLKKNDVDYSFFKLICYNLRRQKLAEIADSREDYITYFRDGDVNDRMRINEDNNYFFRENHSSKIKEELMTLHGFGVTASVCALPIVGAFLGGYFGENVIKIILGGVGGAIISSMMYSVLGVEENGFIFLDGGGIGKYNKIVRKPYVMNRFLDNLHALDKIHGKIIFVANEQLSGKIIRKLEKVKKKRDRLKEKVESDFELLSELYRSTHLHEGLIVSFNARRYDEMLGVVGGTLQGIPVESDFSDPVARKIDSQVRKASWEIGVVNSELERHEKNVLGYGETGSEAKKIIERKLKVEE